MKQPAVRAGSERSTVVFLCTEGNLHRGISCNNCNAAPIVGKRFKCLNCIDYDVCEDCEPVDRHNPRHVFVKINVPLPPMLNPRKALLDPFYPGSAMAPAVLAWTTIKQLKRMTLFSRIEIEMLYQQFVALSEGEPGHLHISRATFMQCLGPLGSKASLVANLVFDVVYARGDEVITFPSFVRGLSVLLKGSFDEKAELAYQGYDMEDSGSIGRSRMRTLLTAQFEVNMHHVKEVVDNLDEDLLSKFAVEEDRPVSSLFTAAIPHQSHLGPEKAREGDAMPANLIDQALSGFGEVGGPRGSASGHGRGAQSPQTLWRARRLSASMQGVSSAAIELVVTRVFDDFAAEPSRLRKEEFLAAATVEPTLIAWIEVLGTIF
ncbi:uncharacterized protein MONBRDRAFT_34778 [Monosiga brevicollis MX1]|uniref:ZZ-type domain-containing protein n=1 Tax=Monosiga brevicollis TaxID=81824 RepID=A9VE11_MONBE|nr:uncharacterized protein MONBRDRAFT_34778 [Monosiga brevicollis MX1]EDQ84228.1 predicted protein [Monosiga brevicollis MX1]|eukprot:XP_001750952.1 hypothetical protein [Monosiga brevicollis MX1]